MRKAAVIGGGAAGMMTAVLAAGEKTEIHLYEKNEKLPRFLQYELEKGPKGPASASFASHPATS